MRLELKKFGNILSSRPAGKEAWLSAQAYALSELQPDEKIEVDFNGVSVLSPSWADEVLTPLKNNYPGRIIFLQSDNPTVKATLDLLSGLK